jgi:hypothetical protein
MELIELLSNNKIDMNRWWRNAMVLMKTAGILISGSNQRSVWYEFTSL